jgi:hypothetical protein
VAKETPLDAVSDSAEGFIRKIPKLLLEALLPIDEEERRLKRSPAHAGA